MVGLNLKRPREENNINLHFLVSLPTEIMLRLLFILHFSAKAERTRAYSIATAPLPNRSHCYHFTGRKTDTD